MRLVACRVRAVLQHGALSARIVNMLKNTSYGAHSNVVTGPRLRTTSIHPLWNPRSKAVPNPWIYPWRFAGGTTLVEIGARWRRGVAPLVNQKKQHVEQRVFSTAACFIGPRLAPCRVAEIGTNWAWFRAVIYVSTSANDRQCFQERSSQLHISCRPTRCLCTPRTMAACPCTRSPGTTFRYVVRRSVNACSVCRQCLGASIHESWFSSCKKKSDRNQNM